mgnify:CR=1 FL=1
MFLARRLVPPTIKRYNHLSKPSNKEDQFAKLGLHDSFCSSLKRLGFEAPTEIQSIAIPKIFSGKDILATAQTGTGKTAAFGLPLLQKITSKQLPPSAPRSPRSLILAPTRELALQILDDLESFSANSKILFSCVIGGINQNPQIRKNSRGVDVLVAAPGRLLDLINQGHIRLNHTEFLVLDECDRLLDMGFLPDVKRIIKTMSKKRQSLLFSATIPAAVKQFAKEILSNPDRIDIAPVNIAAPKIKQYSCRVTSAQKPSALRALLRFPEVSRAIVFTRTKHKADKVSRMLNSSGFLAEVIHGNKSQNARQRALTNFKEGKAWILVATDVAARGIDIDGVTHVINYELSNEPENYIHRIGRTGRAGAEGVAWTLLDGSEGKTLKAVETLIKKPIEEIELEIPEEELEQQLIKKPASGRNRKSVDKADATRKTAASGRKTRKRKRRTRSKRGEENANSI